MLASMFPRPAMTTVRTFIIAVVAVVTIAAGATVALVVRSADRKAQPSFTATEVEGAFSRVGIRLSRGSTPSANVLPITFFAPAMKTYVLVWPSAAVLRRIHQMNGPSRAAGKERILGNVEFDLPVDARYAEGLIRTITSDLERTHGS